MINRLDLKTVLDWVPEGCSVLDLGCGDGAFFCSDSAMTDTLSVWVLKLMPII